MRTGVTPATNHQNQIFNFFSAVLDRESWAEAYNSLKFWWVLLALNQWPCEGRSHALHWAKNPKQNFGGRSTNETCKGEIPFPLPFANHLYKGSTGLPPKVHCQLIGQNSAERIADLSAVGRIKLYFQKQTKIVISRFPNRNGRISTPRLNTLLCVHLEPINLVIY